MSSSAPVFSMKAVNAALTASGEPTAEHDDHTEHDENDENEKDDE